MRGLRKMPCWRSAAATRNSPSRGLACSSCTVAMARSVTRVASCFGVLALSGNPANCSATQRRSVRYTCCRLHSRYAAMLLTGQPSLCNFTTARRAAAGSVSSRYGGKRRAARTGGGPSARRRLTVCGLGRRPKRTAQMAAISLAWKAGCSALSSWMCRRIGSGNRRCFSTLGGAKRLASPSASKRAARR